jgi:hypothetical protein
MSYHDADDLSHCIENLESNDYLCIPTAKIDYDSIRQRFELPGVDPFGPNCHEHHDRSAIAKDWLGNDVGSDRYVCAECMVRRILDEIASSAPAPVKTMSATQQWWSDLRTQVLDAREDSIIRTPISMCECGRAVTSDDGWCVCGRNAMD